MILNIVSEHNKLKNLGLVTGDMDVAVASALLSRLEREGMRPPPILDQRNKLNYVWDNEYEASQLPDSKR